MGIFKCKMCGGELNVNKGDKIVECEFCGTTQTVSTSDDEKILKMIARGNSLRNEGEFDKAYNIFEQIILEGKPDAEVYWNLLLCKYGITYVDDYDGKKKPTINRMSLTPILDDEDYKKVLELADVVTKENYVMQAEQISKIQDNIINIVKNEKPYDIFISYKETDEYGDRTKDSILAQEIYDNLTKEGYKVFLSRICLSSVAGQEYEPYIYSALYSAKIMVLVTTNVDYINAVWVKNEWSRFLNMMKQDQSKKIIPCFKDIDAYDLPKEIRNIQALDMNKLGFIQDLVVGINKIMHKGNTSNTNTTSKNDAYVDDAIKSGLELIKNASLNDIQKDKLQKINEKIFSIDVSNPYYDLFDFVLHSNTKESLETANNIINKNNEVINKVLFNIIFKLTKNEFNKLNDIDSSKLSNFNKNYFDYLEFLIDNYEIINKLQLEDKFDNLKGYIEEKIICVYNYFLQNCTDVSITNDVYEYHWTEVNNLYILYNNVYKYLNMTKIYEIGKQIYKKYSLNFKKLFKYYNSFVRKIFFSLNKIAGYTESQIDSHKKNISISYNGAYSIRKEPCIITINGFEIEIFSEKEKINITYENLILVHYSKFIDNYSTYSVLNIAYKINNNSYSVLMFNALEETNLVDCLSDFFEIKNKVSYMRIWSKEYQFDREYLANKYTYIDKMKPYDDDAANSTSTSGCYVATCVYGSYDCPEVWRLRRYRDNYLDEHWWGRAFIKVYYAISPTLVKWFGNKDWFRKPIKRILNKKIDKLAEKGYEDTPYNDKY